ncbi:putative non-heme dioxygenase domain, isopenicillin N synthase [Medicago truncatula]|uniref:Putative non-heme dioxygenase domain, isopenicillin N synthase n=1 Tax=Medicago truncatula TaxID=3880 RepID=A0A396JE24_MEDTR|nr:putative non-heme dioxygenase domain, isopenicillin N synthase [Medicago truncatula]
MVSQMSYCEQSSINDVSVNDSNSKLSIPPIDLTGIHNDLVLKDEVVRKVQNASENWGFFQVINHGIPTQILDEMIKGTCRFHQQDAKVRKEYYTCDPNKKVVYVSNYSLYHDPAANWRDSLGFTMTPNQPKSEEFQEVCRFFCFLILLSPLLLGSRGTFQDVYFSRGL